MLYRTPALDRDDERVLKEINGFYDDFVRATGGARASQWVGGVRKRMTAGAIQGSNTIEGYAVDLATASAIVADAPTGADVPEASREAVAGYRDALTWAIKAPDMPFFSYSEVGLSALHFMMMRHWPGKSPGLYRAGGIIVTGAEPLTPAYVGPPPEDIPTLMGELAEWLNSGDLDAPVLVRAALAHLNLVSIHPWRDGNGRMSRCLHTLVIARDGRTHPEFCSIEEWLGFEINTFDYYRNLRNVQHGSYAPARDAHSWIRFVLRAHHLQAQTVGKYLARGRQLWDAAEAITKAHGLRERMGSALYAAASLRLRRDDYQAEEGLSRDQAIRDIRQMEQAGLLAAIGYGATLSYQAAGELKDAVTAIEEALIAPAIEPYE